MFKKLNLRFSLAASPFENLRYRDRTVLLLCRDSAGKYLLATKEFYPDGVCRLLGGGVDRDEDVLKAAQRELEEETGVGLEPDRFVPLLEVFVEGKYNDDLHTLVVFVYFVQLEDKEVVAGDDVKEVVKMSEAKYRENTRKLLSLSIDLLYRHPGGDEFSWGDYGQVYGFIQDKALEETLSRKL